MGVTKDALGRIRTIDKCLQNNLRKWTLEDLRRACSKYLIEENDRQSEVAVRTTQKDLEHMRNGKFGYDAPIEVYERKYYRYTDPNFTIYDQPIGKEEMSILREAMDVLVQFKSFSLFDEYQGVLKKLEDKIFREQGAKPIVHLESNPHLKGLEFLDTLYHGILNRLVLRINYQPFNQNSPSEWVFHPLLLKEYNNRWFCIGHLDQDERIANLAIDRIQKIEPDFTVDYEDFDFDGEQYFKHVIGVSVNPAFPPKDVYISADANSAPYIETKPLHASQELVERFEDGSCRFKLFIQPNYEFKSRIRSFGEGVAIERPAANQQD